MSKHKNQKYNIALIGAGGMGKRWARALSRMEEVNLYYMCDKDYKRAIALSEEIKKCPVVSDWKECVKDPAIDIAVIVLPHNILAEVSAEFIKAGKHVLCEKPGGISSAEVKKNIALATKHKVQYMVGFNHRFHDAFLKMRTLFEKKTIGEPLFVRARYGFGGRKGYEKEWRLNKKISGGGELIDQGVHMIDMARSFLGEFPKAIGFTAHNFWKASGEDNAYALLKNKKGQVATLHISWTHWKPEHVFELYGTKGYLIVEGLGKKYGGKEVLKVGIRAENFTDYPKETVIECDNDADNSLIKEMRAFFEAVQKKKEPIPSGKDASEVLKIVEKIYKQNT